MRSGYITNNKWVFNKQVNNELTYLLIKKFILLFYIQSINIFKKFLLYYISL